MKKKRLSDLSVQNSDLLIAANESVLIDKSIDVGAITILGELKCPENTNKYVIKTTGIMIHGKLICGTPDSRFNGELQIRLKENPANDERDQRGIMVASPGELSLFGSLKNSEWQKLSATLEVGSRDLKLTSPVQWSIGDEIVVGPTNFNPLEAETFLISKLESSTHIILDRKAKFRHWGTLQTVRVKNQSYQLDERAVVANLKRNIHILADADDPESLNKIGGHIMVMKGAKSYIDSVELQYMGQLGQIARYPFHWHLTGDVTGQFIANSSIHRSFQRCITVHGTSNAIVKNNVCYDHIGHGYFLENGNEVNNTLENNVGILSRRAPSNRALLISDYRGNDFKFSPPATFWISNPNNRVVGNVAAGSLGSGFWMAFVKGLKCNENTCQLSSDEEANVFPLQEKTLAFDNNTANSSVIGMTWDGAPDGKPLNNPLNGVDHELVSAHYAPPERTVFKNLNVFKNINAGVYFRGNSVYFENSIFADNGTSLFFAYNQISRKSLIVGQSQNTSDRDQSYFYKKSIHKNPSGIVMYDGPFDLQEIDFALFPTGQISYEGEDVTPVPINSIGGANRFTNAVSRLSFEPQPYQRVLMSVMNEQISRPWSDSPWSISLKDVDGSLTGETPPVIVVPNHPFNSDSSCKENTRWKALVCRYKVGLITFRAANSVERLDDIIPFSVLRSDSIETIDLLELSRLELSNKFNMILGDKYKYWVKFAPEFIRPPKFQILFQSEKVGDISPTIKITGVGSSCRLRDISKATSLQALTNSKTPAYFASQGELHVKLQTKNEISISENASATSSGLIDILCN